MSRAWIPTNSKKATWILKESHLSFHAEQPLTPDNHGLYRHQIFSLHQNVTCQVNFMVLFYVPICLAYKCLSAGTQANCWISEKTKTKTIMAFLKLSGQKWVEMWVKRRHEVIAYNMHDLFVPSCGIIKCLMCVIQHSRSCDYQGATEAWRRQVWAELPRKKKKATPPYWRIVQLATFQLLFWLKQMALTVSQIQIRLKWAGPTERSTNTTVKTD